jgi:hypothetical protein
VSSVPAAMTIRRTMNDNDGQPVFKGIGAHPDETDDNVFLSQSRFHPSWRACRYCGVS